MLQSLVSIVARVVTSSDDFADVDDIVGACSPSVNSARNVVVFPCEWTWTSKTLKDTKQATNKNKVKESAVFLMFADGNVNWNFIILQICDGLRCVATSDSFLYECLYWMSVERYDYCIDYLYQDER